MRTVVGALRGVCPAEGGEAYGGKSRDALRRVFAFDPIAAWGDASPPLQRSQR